MASAVIYSAGAFQDGTNYHFDNQYENDFLQRDKDFAAVDSSDGYLRASWF